MTGEGAGAGRPPFASFLQGGFESSTHRRFDGRQLDLLAATGHDRHALTDYALCRDHGLRTVRDALRWHLIEAAPGRYDWSSALPMLRAARQAGVQVVWDLCHYGVPHDLDIWSPAFVDRFAAFARAAAALVREETDPARQGGAPVFCPMNEVSFWAWSGGDTGGLYPHAAGRGDELKRQLVRAAVAAIAAVRGDAPATRFIQAEPLINIVPNPGRPGDEVPAETYRLAQFHALDMLAGRMHPELGGREEFLDVVGVNFYFNNQWVNHGECLAMGHRLYRPFQDMLRELHARYDRPILVSETGAEGANGAGWLRYVMGEVRAALAEGLPVEGVCLYPVMDYPGWDDERHCACGLIRLDDAYERRGVDAALARQVAEELRLLDPMLPLRRRAA